MAKTKKADTRVYDADLRKLAKRANQRMRELEKHGIKSPAYKGVQASLEMLGVRKKSTTGRRFSETGKATNQNEIEQQKAIIQKFLDSKTSTVKGYNDYLDNMYETADENLSLREAGISKEQYMNLWEELPDNENDRKFYAEFYIIVMEAYEFKRRSGLIKDERKLTTADIVNKMQGAKDFKSALKAVGLDLEDYTETRNRLERDEQFANKYNPSRRERQKGYQKKGKRKR